METLLIGSRGPLVELLQSNLNSMNFLTDGIDGIFGNNTKEAVQKFQTAHDLVSDGIVGVSTWNALAPYINGYDRYTIRSGDTIFRLATLFSTTVDRIIIANPGIDVYNLKIGKKIIIPYGEIVPTNISYNYEIMILNLNSFFTIYPFLEFGYVGSSELDRTIPYIKIGKGSKKVFYNGSFHANEWITSTVLMKFIENYAIALADNTKIYGHDARKIFNDVSIYIIPMVNPDGVDLVTNTFDEHSTVYKFAQSIASLYPTVPFPSGWKANIKGIDLNLQFPAEWETAKKVKYGKGITTPAPRDYVGLYPLEAREAKAVYNFTLEHEFALSLSYHTQGKVIFWKFLDYLPPNSLEIGNQLSKSSGYTLLETPYESSFAGYKDWFIQQYNRPGYTIEAGIGTNPLPISQFDDIYNDNEGMLILGAILA